MQEPGIIAPRLVIGSIAGVSGQVVEDSTRVADDGADVAILGHHATIGQLANSGRRVPELDRGRHRDAKRVAAFELDDDDRSTRRLRGRHVNDEEVTRERALARAIEPQVRASMEQGTRERELVALEREEATPLPGRRQTRYGITTSERRARKAQEEGRLERSHDAFSEPEICARDRALARADVPIGDLR